MRRWLCGGLLVALLLGGAWGCAKSTEPVQTDEKLPAERFPKKK